MSIWGVPATSNISNLPSGVCPAITSKRPLLESRRFRCSIKLIVFPESANGTYTIDLNGYFIAVDSTVSGVTASNGIVLSGATPGDGVNTGYEVVESNEESISASLLFEYAELVDGTYVIKDKIFTKHLYPGNLTTNNLKFENCIFYGCGMNVGDASGYSDGRKVIYEDCQFTDTNGDAWAILVYGSVDVIDCTFTNVKHGAIQIHDDSEDIKVKISESPSNVQPEILTLMSSLSS